MAVVITDAGKGGLTVVEQIPGVLTLGVYNGYDGTSGSVNLIAGEGLKLAQRLMACLTGHWSSGFELPEFQTACSWKIVRKLDGKIELSLKDKRDLAPALSLPLMPGEVKDLCTLLAEATKAMEERN